MCSREVCRGKKYIQPDQVVVSNEGLFFIFEGVILPIPQLNYDSNGLYILSDFVMGRDRCPRGHRLCPFCRGGCVNFKCRHHCNCI